jgi:hypothetical protein
MKKKRKHQAQILEINMFDDGEDAKIEMVYVDNDEALTWAFWSLMNDIRNDERLARCWKNAKTATDIFEKAAN